MALTTGMINEGRNNVKELYESSMFLTETCEQILNITKSDKDYTIFKEKTEHGRELNEKLEKLIDSVQKLSPTIQSIAHKTNNFLNRQEELNNRGA